MKLTNDFFNKLLLELDKKYFPNVKYYGDDKACAAIHYATELFSNGCSTYRKFVKTLGYNCGDNLENIHEIVSKYVEDFGKFKWHPRTIDKIITHVGYSLRGAPMGRPSVGTLTYESTNLKGEKVTFVNPMKKRVFDCAVPMSDGAYDRGGAYWGHGKQLRVKYTKDLTYVHFYRKGEE